MRTVTRPSSNLLAEVSSLTLSCDCLSACVVVVLAFENNVLEDKNIPKREHSCLRSAEEHHLLLRTTSCWGEEETQPDVGFIY